jgi:hypothetical protein
MQPIDTIAVRAGSAAVTLYSRHSQTKEAFRLVSPQHGGARSAVWGVSDPAHIPTLFVKSNTASILPSG